MCTGLRSTYHWRALGSVDRWKMIIPAKPQRSKSFLRTIPVVAVCVPLCATQASKSFSGYWNVGFAQLL